MSEMRRTASGVDVPVKTLFVCNVEKLETVSRAEESVPATDFISAERKFTEVCAFARPLAELVTPPTMRHHAETSSTMIADLRLPHPILALQFEGSCLRAWESQFGTNLRVAHGEPSSWLMWIDKGPLSMSGTHRPWVACCDAAGSAEARTLS